METMARRSIRGKRGASLAAATVMAAGVITIRAAVRTSPVPSPLMEGIAAAPCSPGQVIAIPAGHGARYDGPASVLLRQGAGSAATGQASVMAPAARCIRAATTASKQWLAAGQVPGDTPAMRSMAARALLDLRLSTQANGAVVAGWHRGWHYAWPRDSSWVAVALAVTGHGPDALRILRFLKNSQLARR